MASIPEVTDATWQAEVMSAPVPVLVDFWGPNCPPCVAIAPCVEALANEHGGKLKVVKVNVHENLRTASTYRVKSMPTFVVLKEGREVARQPGTNGGLDGLRRLVGAHL